MKNLKLIEKAITKPKGQFSRIVWSRNCKVKKGAPEIKKTTYAHVGRLGLVFNNLASVKQKRASGELPAENTGLPAWAEWVKFPHLIRNKKSGQLYLRIYPMHGTKKVSFEIDGKEVDEKEIQDYLGAQEKVDKSDLDCQIVKVEDITDIQ